MHPTTPTMGGTAPSMRGTTPGTTSAPCYHYPTVLDTPLPSRRRTKLLESDRFVCRFGTETGGGGVGVGPTLGRRGWSLSVWHTPGWCQRGAGAHSGSGHTTSGPGHHK